MKSLSETFLGRVLGRLADAIVRHRWLFLWPQFFLFGLCVIYTCFHLQFDMNRDNLVGSGQLYHQRYQQFRKEFNAQDDLVVIVESENAEKNRQFVERLGEKLSSETNLFTDVFYKGDLKMLGKKALLFVPETNLVEIRDTLGNFLPFLKEFTHATNLDSLFALVNYQVYHAKREANAENDALLKALPMLTRIVEQANSSLQRSGTPPSPGITAVFGANEEAEQDIYITYAKGRLYLVTARARAEDLNNLAVERLRDLVAQTEHEVPGINVGITGEPVLEHDEMEQSQRDSTIASVVSLVICALIFIYGYQETGRPLKATVCLLVGLGYTMAFTTLTVGHLNILTITFVPILIGLAIDFGVHLITRYEEELRNGRTEAEAMRKAMIFTGQGIFTGAMTTAAAFLAMALTDFKGIQEMGIICGGGMIVCFIPMITLLPVLLFRGRQNALDHKESAERGVGNAELETEPYLPEQPPKKVSHRASMGEMRARIENIWLSRPKTVVFITVALTALAITQFHKVYFDYNLLNMQSAGLPAVVFEKKLIDSTPQSVLFAAVVADTPEQALKLVDKLNQLPSVGTNISMAPFLTGDVTEKLKLIGEIKTEIAPVQFQPPDRKPVDILGLDRTLYSTVGYMGAAADAVLHDPPPAPSTTPVVNTNAAPEAKAQPSEPPLADQLLQLRDSINRLRKRMLNMDAGTAAAKLGAFQLALFNDVNETFQSIHDQDNSSRLRAEDLPLPLRNRFIGVTGKYLIQVYPKNKIGDRPFDIWQHEDQKRFVEEIRSIYPEVTGTPVQLLAYTSLLKDSYVQAAYYALAAITLMVLLHFRKLGFVLLALLPVAVGTAWMAGLMGCFNIPFNPANIMTLPLVIGIGVTNGIHILNRYVEEGSASLLSKSTGKAVFVSGLTAIAGFGSLILAQHQGIRSLGEVMSMGVALCMVAALAIVPALLNLWGTKAGRTEKTTQ